MTTEQKKEYVEKWMKIYNGPDGKAWVHPGIVQRLKTFINELKILNELKIHRMNL